MAALGHEQKEVPHLGHKVLTEGLTRVTQPSGDHPASRARGDGRGAGLGVGQARPGGGGIMMEGVGPAQAPPAAPSAPWVPATQTPPPRRAGSQSLLQVQVPGEVECASLRLVEVPRDVAVAGKREVQTACFYFFPPNCQVSPKP